MTLGSHKAYFSSTTRAWRVAYFASLCVFAAYWRPISTSSAAGLRAAWTAHTSGRRAVTAISRRATSGRASYQTCRTKGSKSTAGPKAIAANASRSGLRFCADTTAAATTPAN